jgi:hypothetical protein
VAPGKNHLTITKEKDHIIRKLNQQNNELDKNRRTVHYKRIYSEKFPASGASKIKYA